MTNISVITKYGVLVDTINPKEYDLSKPLAKADLLDEILYLIRKSNRMEEQEDKKRASGWKEAGY